MSNKEIEQLIDMLLSRMNTIEARIERITEIVTLINAKELIPKL